MLLLNKKGSVIHNLGARSVMRVYFYSNCW
nr:MAG TPA: hypothetical protein [Caudoviricetes sp.]